MYRNHALRRCKHGGDDEPSHLLGCTVRNRPTLASHAFFCVPPSIAFHAGLARRRVSPLVAHAYSIALWRPPASRTCRRSMSAIRRGCSLSHGRAMWASASPIAIAIRPGPRREDRGYMSARAFTHTAGPRRYIHIHFVRSL